MRINKLLAGIVIALFLIISAAAFTTNEITAPSAYQTYNTLTVNISGGLNVSAFSFLTARNTSANFTQHVINITILNKSSSSGAYGILDSSLSLTINATNRTPDVFWNFTATLTEGRHWIRLNFTNVSRADDGSFGGSLSAERIVDIDLEAYVLTIGQFDKINFSLDSGNITIAGNYATNKNNITLTTIGGTKVYCGVDNSKVWSCS